MDEELDKKNKKLQEDPDDFDVKNSIFTQESIVSTNSFLITSFAHTLSLSVNLFQMRDMLKKSLEIVPWMYSKTNVDYLTLLL